MGNIKKSLIALGSLLIAMSCNFSAGASELLKQQVIVHDTVLWGLPVTDISVKRNGELMTIGMDMDLKDYKLKGDKVSVFAPVLVNGEQRLELDPVGLYSRIRYIQYLRDGGEGVEGENEISFKYSKRPSDYMLWQSMPYQDWMNGATLYLSHKEYGCCHTLLTEATAPLARWYETAFIPELVYETEIKAEVEKIRELTGRAYVDFPVNKIVIYPDYRNNAYELGKIISTIDSVRNDKDITVKSLHIAGTASPEGPYDNNVYLAKNRTIALKDYVRNLYQFPEGFITTSYEPVDWAGLAEWLENHNLENKDEILAIVNSDIEPYARNSKIKTDYPQQYDWLLMNVYPSLRHSDYRIEYTIRRYNDIEEIAEVIKTTPQKLSLNEMYLLANSLEAGSEAYNEVFETAVRMYPNDEIANLNAANVALQRNDTTRAAAYIAKAGNSDEAVYARGILEVHLGNYDKALEYFNSISERMPQAAKAWQEIYEIINIEEN